MNDTYTSLPEKPLPRVAPGNQAYWQGLRDHQFLVQRCRGCQRLRHYPRPLCDNCYSFDYDWAPIDTHGSVHSWSVTHHPFHTGFKRETPYTTLTVDMADGVRVQAPLLDDTGGVLKCGAPVELVFIDIDETWTYPGFKLATV